MLRFMSGDIWITVTLHHDHLRLLCSIPTIPSVCEQTKDVPSSSILVQRCINGAGKFTRKHLGELNTVFKYFFNTSSFFLIIILFFSP